MEALCGPLGWHLVMSPSVAEACGAKIAKPRLTGPHEGVGLYEISGSSSTPGRPFIALREGRDVRYNQPELPVRY